MEQVGGRGMQTNVDMEGSIVDEVKIGESNVGSVAEDTGSGGVSAGEPIALEKITGNDSGTAMGSEEKMRKRNQRRRKKRWRKPPDAPKRFKR